MKTLQLRDVAVIRQQLSSGEAKAIRQRSRLSLSEIASAVGVTPTSVCRWENGECSPRIPEALKYKAIIDELQASTVEMAHVGG